MHSLIAILSLVSNPPRKNANSRYAVTAQGLIHKIHLHTSENARYCIVSSKDVQFKGISMRSVRVCIHIIGSNPDLLDVINN